MRTPDESANAATRLLRYETLVRNLQEAVLVEDERRRIVLTNRRFVDLFRIPVDPDRLVGSDCSNAAEESKALFVDPAGFVKRIDDVLSARALVLGDELEMADGTHLTRDYVPVFAADEYLGHMWVYRDVTDQVIARRRLEELALTDELTGLANRRRFGIRLSMEIERQRREEHPLTLILADIDHFKRYNDTHGHAAGDDALRSFAAVLTRSVREGDAVARYGGEEFALILPDTDRERGMEIAERCLRNVHAHRWPLVPVTASFGVASSAGPLPDEQILAQMSRLTEEADRVLYAAKAAGRDRVMVADTT